MRALRPRLKRTLAVMAAVSYSVLLFAGSQVSAQITPLPIPDPQPGGYGLEATKPQPPPTQGATITVPGNGTTFSYSPITVQGICPNDLLVQLFNNDVMVGAVMCENSSFAIEVSLFGGANELKAIVYDDLYQPGPESNVVQVNYNDSRLTAFGQSITLTSSFGRRAAAAGVQLVWPLQLSGGTGPYAFSIDWGDGSEAQLVSQSVAGALNIAHVYRNAGIYQVNVRVTDADGVSAFLQLIAVSNGEIVQGAGEDDSEGGATRERVVILWVPAAVALVLMFPAYWLGRRSQLVSLRNKMLKERDNYEKSQAS